MTARVMLICHGSTEAVRAAKFPADEPLDELGSKNVKALADGLPEAGRCWTSPEQRTRQTAQALGLNAQIEPRLRAVLRMSFVDALSIDQIGAVYAVHRATAARWIQRGCESVFAETRRLLAERLALSPTELDRMTALIQSQLEVSLSQLLPLVTSDPQASGS